MSMETEKITIDKSEYEELIADSKFLAALIDRLVLWKL
jgi:hypothetical protein